MSSKKEESIQLDTKINQEINHVVTTHKNDIEEEKKNQEMNNQLQSLVDDIFHKFKKK